MKLIASRELAGYPAELVLLPNGDVVVLSSGVKGKVLAAYNRDLTPVWSSRIGGDGVYALVLASNGTPWVLEGPGASAFGEGGVRVSRVEISRREGMHLSAVGEVDDGFVLAWEHDGDAPMRAPVLERVQYDGSVRWSTTLPVGAVANAAVVQWMPRTWVHSYRSGNLAVSGDAVLACFSEMPHSGIGFGYVLSLTDGALRFTTQVGPIADVEPLGGGAFLVGYQGSGTFETLRYERDGRVLERWPSHGHYVVMGGDIRVIEMENILPSKMHLVRLAAAGSVTRGEWLDGYYTSRPHVLADGTLFFLRHSALCAARDLLVVERLRLSPAADVLLSPRIVGAGRSVYFAASAASAEAGGNRIVRVDF